MDYLPHTAEDLQIMLGRLGISSVDTLFAQIPDHLRLKELPELPAPLADPELRREIRRLEEQNFPPKEGCSFLGAGFYHHYIPPLVDQVLLRPEFYTAYTPYQAELSQGTLQSIYEFQTLICLLTELEVANASLYDGATAVAEAALLAVEAKGVPRVAVSAAVNPQYRQVLKTYADPRGIEVVTLPVADLTTPLPDWDRPQEWAALVAQQPNFFGAIEPMARLCQAAHDAGALFIAAVNPISLALLQPPGAYGADLAVGEGQPLGNPAYFGGASLGFMAAKNNLLRRLPGRLAGATVDREGNKGYVLTLQTREQHIRRERATSNICTNQALMALAAVVYLAAMGKQGLRKVAEICLQRAHYAYRQLIALPGVEPAGAGSFWNEFVLQLQEPPDSINRKLRRRGIVGGLPLGRYYPGRQDQMLLCVTELNTRADIDALVAAWREDV